LISFFALKYIAGRRIHKPTKIAISIRIANNFVSSMSVSLFYRRVYHPVGNPKAPIRPIGVQ
jgi:hypothetical protein